MPEATWHSLSVEEILRELSVGPEGLTSDEAERRLSRFGPNEITKRKRVSPLRVLLKQLANFFIAVLFFAAVLAFSVSFLPGEEGRRLTAFFILGIIVISVGLSFFEEYRAQKELEALDKLLVFKAGVLRNGATVELDASRVVPGDVLVLRQGQKVPADARLIEANGLRTDESSLTGESLGVDKSPEPVAPDAPLAERTSMVYASTFITHGTGLAAAVRTGMGTEVGKIAATLERMTERPTPFQTEVRRMARQMAAIVGALAVGIALLLLFALREPPVDVALNTLSLAVATIPESLPIVLIFALALGARVMASRKAVVRRLAVVESLGSVDTICTDKTGTLTRNVLTVQELYVDGRRIAAAGKDAAPGVERSLLDAGLLCNDAVAEDPQGTSIMGDPVDTALLVAALSAGIDIEGVRRGRPRIGEIPFSSERKMMTTLHSTDGGLVAFSKGAPGAILPRCSAYMRGSGRLPMDDSALREIRSAIEELEGEAWYVLAFAANSLSSADAPATAEMGMTFLGLQAMRDPPRPEVFEALSQAREAGIRVVMITGDSALTAQAVGRQLGIGDRCVEAREIESLDGDRLRERAQSIDIVARATPQTKQSVLQALQEDGHFVAMTGDGVNDSTALKQSDVGIAMGLRGTDIAKESSAMVLLDDNFATIIEAIREGRRIFDNIRKFINYLLSTSLGEVFVVLALSIAGFFPLSARMLLWINVVTDLVPAGALAADPVVPGVMRRRPRRHDEPILNASIYATIAGSVLRTLISYGLIFWAGLRLGDLAYARTMLFTSIVLHSFTRIMVVRQMDNLPLWSNPALLWSYAAAVGLQLLALYTPLRALFDVVPLDWRAWAVMIPVVAGSSAAGIFMTRWILKLVPLWDEGNGRPKRRGR